jgi:hypothetical protein
MRRLRKLLILIALAVAGASHSADELPTRIDGTSDARFRASHAALVESLTPGERVQLLLAEQIIQAAATPPRDRSSDPTRAHLTPLLAVRSELDGLTFGEILELSRTKKAHLDVGFVTEPSNPRLERP